VRAYVHAACGVRVPTHVRACVCARVRVCVRVYYYYYQCYYCCCCCCCCCCFWPCCLGVTPDMFSRAEQPPRAQGRSNFPATFGSMEAAHASSTLPLPPTGALGQDAAQVAHSGAATLPIDMDPASKAMEEHFFLTMAKAADKIVTFRVDPSCIKMRFDRETERAYVGLSLIDDDSQLPMRHPHVSVGFEAIFHDWPSFWKAKQEMQSLLAARTVTALLQPRTRSWNITSFCELHALVELLQDILAKYTHGAFDKPATCHITFNMIGHETLRHES